MQGRLIHAETGLPLAGARVRAMRLDEGPADEELIAWEQEMLAEQEPELDPNEAALCLAYPSTLTSADGSFDLAYSTRGDRPRAGAARLRIEIEGGPGWIVPLPHGTWKRAPDSDAPIPTYATWLVGDLRLP